MTIESSDFEAASAVLFCASLLETAKKDSRGDPMKWLKDKLAKYGPAADEILGNNIGKALTSGSRITSESVLAVNLPPFL